jgi:hypothetical protein
VLQHPPAAHFHSRKPPVLEALNYQTENPTSRYDREIAIKKPAQWRVIKFWQHIKLASNIAYFVAFCKPD